MSSQKALRPEFVEFIPDEIAAGVIYISIRYATATHLCACGCGREVITPISPTDWQITFDGEQVSLRPSVGNWSFPCQSHYRITRGRIQWARRWSQREIDAGRARNRLAKSRASRQTPSSQRQDLARRRGE